MLSLIGGLGLLVAVLGAVVAFQRRNGNKGVSPAPYAGVHDYKEGHNISGD